MKKSLFALLFLFAVYLRGMGQSTVLPESYLPGNASVAYSARWSAFHNPAVLSSEKEVAISALYQNRFGIGELSTQAAALSVPTKWINIGGAVSHFGFSSYSEVLAGVAFARTFDKFLTLGIQFNYYSVYLSNSAGNRGALSAQVGLLSQITPNFTVGFNAFNPTRQKVHYQDITKDIPSLFSLGASYRFSDEALWLVQVDKELDTNARWATGFEYCPVKELAVRVGGYGAPFIPTLGVGVAWKHFQLDVNFERHPVLGVTSTGALRYRF